MMIASALGPVFLLILLGAVLNRLDFPGRTYWPGIERLTYYVLFPALLIHRLALTEYAWSILPPLILTLVLALGTVSLLILLTRRWQARDGAALTSVYQGSVRFNTYIGLAAADALFGPAGLAFAAIVLGLKIPLVNIGCVLMFSLALGDARLDWRKVGRELGTNPLILGCVIGLLLNFTGIGLPGWSADTLAFLGATALPLGLLAVGVALAPRALGGDAGAIMRASGFKFLAMPGMLWGFAALLGLDPLMQQVLVLLGCLPTATSAYILARQLGGNATLMANLITAQSLLAFVVIPLWMWVIL
ncbi:AEC family transporter [Natronospirillum operosum]|uniref:AEC family transporter n=1 Tax=Natronospirillum operosum TaxID=2759953 RepID=A0A4Z0W8Q4_9GAMM|nr:AEC family transporter [Natronospirillum operosum]TGG93937.1 AEC family transporter [Natronospirillum operosum]